MKTSMKTTRDRLARALRQAAAACGAAAVSWLAVASGGAGAAEAGDLVFPAQSRRTGEHGVEVAATATRWKASQTALIVCDFWDSHNCGNAVKRVNAMAPRVAEVVAVARTAGVFVIHAPSDCMAAYDGHEARRRAQEAPRAAVVPDAIDEWQYWISSDEEKAGYPIDASDGGCDDTPAEHAAWEKQLVAEGRRAGGAQWPWRAQHPAVIIDPERDAISDRGGEIWNLLEARGIRNVIVIGVHANMCICGRSFGLRQMARLGKNALLLRDLTDAMYNPAMAPFVGHHRGTELTIAHIERWIAPTALSSDVFGGNPFAFADDARPVVAVMIGEDEYKTWESLPAYAEAELGARYRLRYVREMDGSTGEFAGTSALADASVLLISVRRRALPEAQLQAVRDFIARGGGVVGIRTTSHAFALRPGVDLPAGRAVWPEWDAAVIGGNYQQHHGNDIPTTAALIPGVEHPVLDGIGTDPFPTGSGLYVNTPLRDGATALLTGRARGIDRPEPVAWVHRSPGGGRVFYTSLGHVRDFDRPEFRRLLANAVHWVASREVGEEAAAKQKADERQ